LPEDVVQAFTNSYYNDLRAKVVRLDKKRNACRIIQRQRKKADKVNLQGQ